MFDSARMKVKRGHKHIDDLKCAFDRFIETHPHTFVFDTDTDTNTRIVEVRFGEAIPHEFPLILGDAIHNLRTALDHATWELLGIDGGTQDRATAFPSSSNHSDYETVCRGIKTPRDDTKKFFIALAAHEGGAGEKLYALHRLDIADKHTVILPVIGMARVEKLELVQPNGETLMHMTNCRFTMCPDGRARLMDIPGGGYTIKIDQDSNATIEIFFGDVGFFQTLPLIETLMDLGSSVSDVIGQFVQLVEART
jgi:hypothetical protein